MRNSKSYILTVLAILVSTAFTFGQIDRTKMPKPGPAPQIQLKSPQEFTLDNGLTVMVVEDKKLPRVSYNLRIDNVPALNGDKSGISGLLGSLLGNGTANISKDEFNGEIDFLGANMSFGSSGGFVSGLSKYSDRLMELMADAIINPVFPEDEFNKEKDIAIQGLKTSEKSVQAAADRVGDALVYGLKHPYGEFSTEETLNNITVNDVRAYYEQQFVPSKAYLVIIGDITLEDAKSKVSKYLSPWQSKAKIDRTMPPVLPNPQYAQINFVDMPNAVQTNIIVTNNVQLKMSDKDYHSALIANYILGGSATGYLFKNLRDDHGWTYGSYSSVGASRFGASKFEATAEVRNEVTDSSVVEMLNEINRIRTEKISPEILKTAKAAYGGNFIKALENPSTIANYALNIRLNKLDKDFYKNYLQNINAVTAEDVMNAANKFFKADNLRIIVVGKGADVLEGLEKLDIPILYYDKYASPAEKPVFSKPIPDGVTAQTVLDNYFKAIGGKDKAAAVKSAHSTANVAIEGVPISLVASIKQMAPNKESMEMTAEGMGVLMKQKFNGESGYIEQQGMKRDLTEDQIADRKSSHAIFPELSFEAANVSLESMTTIDGNDVFKLKVMTGDKSSFRFYDANTGYLVRTETETEAQGQKIMSVANYSNYSPVEGIQFPYNMTMKSGPQVLSFNFTNVKLNEGVTDADFE